MTYPTLPSNLYFPLHHIPSQVQEFHIKLDAGFLLSVMNFLKVDDDEVVDVEKQVICVIKFLGKGNWPDLYGSSDPVVPSRWSPAMTLFEFSTSELDKTFHELLHNKFD